MFTISPSQTQRPSGHWFIMKRKIIYSDLEKSEKWKQLLKEKNIDTSYDNIKMNIIRRIDQRVTVEARRDQSISFYAPLGFVITSFGEMQPKELKMESYYSNLQMDYVDYLVMTWDITEHELATKIFGEKAFSTRCYSDSQGIVDFKNLKGGEIRFVFHIFFFLSFVVVINFHDLVLII